MKFVHFLVAFGYLSVTLAVAFKIPAANETEVDSSESSGEEGEGGMTIGKLGSDKQKDRESNGEVTMTTADEARRKTFVDATKALSGVMTHLLKLTGPPGHIFGAFVSVVNFFIDQAMKKNKNIWKLLEDNINIRIGQQIAKYHMERLKSEVFSVLEGRMKKKKFTAEDLQTILDKKRMVFPQNYPSLGFYYDLPLAILYWVPFLIDGFNRLLLNTDGSQDCAIAEMLQYVRENTVLACKAMQRKRYKEVHGITDTMKDTKICRITGMGLRCRKMRELVYQDALSSTKIAVYAYEGGFYMGTDSWDTVSGKITDDTVNYLWTELVEKLNGFFHPDICLASNGCKCPERISKTEIVFKWPDGCFGDAQCLHPCDNFGYGYDYCYTNKKQTGNGYIECKKPDFEKCMPIDPYTITVPDVIPDIKKLLRKK